jgi:hypothetical protein
MPVQPIVYSPEDLALGVDVRMFAPVLDDAGSATGELVGAPDLDPYFTEISGAEAVAQAVALRCGYTPRGVLRDAPDVGMLLMDYLGMALKGGSVEALRGILAIEAQKEERVLTVTVSIDVDRAAQSMAIRIEGGCAEGPFALTLSVTDVTVELLRAN